MIGAVYLKPIDSNKYHLYVSDLYGENETFIANNASKLFVVKNQAYITISADLAYQIFSLNNTEKVKIGRFDVGSNINEVCAMDNYVMFDYWLFNLKSKRIVEKENLEWLFSATPILVYKTAFKDQLIVKIHSGRIDAIWTIEGNNTQKQVGIWSIDMNTGELFKVTDDYKIDNFAIFDENYLYGIKNNRLFQIELK